jgi:SSS family transporter
MILAATPLGTPDYVILGGYFVIMLGIGAYFWRFMKGMTDYFSGRNQIPWWLSGVSYYMTSFSTFLFVSYSQVGYEHGFVSVALGWMVIPAVLIGVLFFATRWRRARIDSPVEYLEERYGLGLRQTFGWANVPVRLIDNGLRLYATGLFVHGAVGLPLDDSILYCGLITLAYTFAGGLWAVAVTDFVQFVVMMAGALLLVPLSLARVGGLRGLVENAPPGFFALAAPETFTRTYLVAWFILLVCNYNTSFGLVQRYYCVRNEREARKVGLFVAALILVGTPIFFLPAMAARQFLPDAHSATIYATICTTLLPSGALGLLIAAMFSATMSSLSGDYNAVASVLTNDVYKRLLDRAATERRLVIVGRVTTFLIGVVPVGIALYVARSIGSDVLFRKMVTVFSIAAPPIALPMLAGLAWRRISNAGAVAGFVAGVGVGLVAYGLITFGRIEAPGKVAEIVLTFSTAGTTFVVMTAVSLLRPARGEEARRCGEFVRRLSTPVETVDTAKAGVVPSPWGAVGVSVAAVAVLLLAIQPWMPWSAGSAVNLSIGAGLLIVGSLMMLGARRRGA